MNSLISEAYPTLKLQLFFQKNRLQQSVYLNDRIAFVNDPIVIANRLRLNNHFLYFHRLPFF